MKTYNMTERLELLKPVVVKDGFGDEQTTYEVVKEVWAERERIGTRRTTEVAEQFPAHSVRWNIRYDHEIDEDWRVNHKGGHLYEVIGIEPNVHRKYKTLVCDRVNE